MRIVFTVLNWIRVPSLLQVVDHAIADLEDEVTDKEIEIVTNWATYSRNRKMR